MSRFKGLRTYIIVTVLPIAAVTINATLRAYDVDPEAEVGVVVMAILAAIMRTVTTTAPGKSG